MKKIKMIIVLLLIITFFTACGGNNFQQSSMEEVKYVTIQLPDFQEFVQYFSVEATSVPPFLPAKIPHIFLSDPKLAEKRISFIHVVIYKTRSHGFKLLIFDDCRPPKIVVSKEF